MKRNKLQRNCMKLACSSVFVSSNFSTSLSDDDYSAFKEFDRGGATIKKWHTKFKIEMS